MAEIDRLQRMGALVKRWRSLPDRRREDILNRAVVYAFCGVVLVIGIFTLLALSIGQTAAAWIVGVMAVFGTTGFFLAWRLGRSRLAWSVVCFLLPILGLVVLLVIPDDAWRDPSA